MANNELVVKGITVNYKDVNKETYISLTDLARFYNAEDPSGVIRNWMSNKDSFLFYSLWEEIHNQNFNSVKLHRIKKEEVGLNRFTMTPKQWKESYNAIGIIPSSGKYSKGTYAHSDIAFEFASWLSPEFKLYLITEFQKLKKAEQKGLGWDAKRELAKLNYHIHTDAIKENLIVPNLTKEQINFIYANEADLLNVALFGKTAGEWKNGNPSLKGNIRDYASINQLLVLANMESYNAILIEQNLQQKERLIQLNQMAKSQLTVLKNHQPKTLIGNKN
ncbi:MAG: KilA-N domain-containing protein [Anaeroplasmataceae bacterium]|nr:KilA-N domain-containing protein [Anaeroplasmataceae bacterium]